MACRVGTKQGLESIFNYPLKTSRWHNKEYLTFHFVGLLYAAAKCRNQLLHSKLLVNLLNMRYFLSHRISRLFLIKRFCNHISKDRLKRIADSLYMSKIRYGVQLYGNVRMNEADPEQKLLGSIQVAQNKMARFLTGKKLLDKIPTKVKGNFR